MTETTARLLFPFSLILAVALWAKGYAAVGDGFSAGAVAGLGAVVQYVCTDHDRARRTVGARWARPMVVLGLLCSLLVVLGPSLFGEPPVTHVPLPGSHVVKIGVLDLHSALAFDLGIAVLVYGTLVGTFDRLFPIMKGDEP